MSEQAAREHELNLGELFALIAYNWRLVVASVCLTVSMVGVFAFFIATPEYEASTRFELLDSDQGGSGLGQVTALTTIAGISFGSSSSEAEMLPDRILSRPFIASVSDDAGLMTDPIFNPTLADPSLFSRFKTAVFGTSGAKPASADDFYVLAILALRERMKITPGENGIIELTITHPIPDRAADIANIIVQQSLTDILERERKDIRDRLGYFAAELLEVRKSLDNASVSVRDFAIRNSLQSPEELARTSSRLSQIRREMEALDESVVALEQLLKPNFDGPSFAADYPIAISLTFRRLLNLSGNPSEWVQPSPSQISGAISQLNAQRASLISSFNSLEALAKDAGEAALELSKLQRDVEVQKAIYQTVITQFETQSLFSGYEKASGRVVETAIAPNRPASPKKVMLAVIAVAVGLFLGVIGAMLLTARRGTLYTHTALEQVFDNVEILHFAPTTRAEGEDTDRSYSVAGRELLASLQDTQKVVAIYPSVASQLCEKLAVSVAKTAAANNESTAILDLSANRLGVVSGQVASGQKDGPSDSAISHMKLEKGVDILSLRNGSTFLRKAFAAEQLSAFRTRYDRLFVVLPDPQNETAISRVVMPLVDTVVVLGERAKSRRPAFEEIKSIAKRANISDLTLMVK